MASPCVSRRVNVGLASIAACALLTFAVPARAFVVDSYIDGTETLYLKWGDNHAGTLGGIVTWSFIPAGTLGSAYCAEACPGVSVDSLNIEISPGGGFISTPLTSLESHIVAMMAQWTAATGIQFVKVDRKRPPTAP